MTLRRVFGATVVVALAGCSLTTSLTGGSNGPVGPKPSGSSGSSSSSSAGTSSEPSSSSSGSGYTDYAAQTAKREEARTAERDRPRAGFADCSDREAYRAKYKKSCDPDEPWILGLSVADAKKRVAQHDASLSFHVNESSTFYKDCQPDHVCDFSPPRWYTGATTPVIVYVNRKLDLGPPAD